MIHSFIYERYAHCPKNNLILGIETEPCHRWSVGNGIHMCQKDGHKTKHIPLHPLHRHDFFMKNYILFLEHCLVIVYTSQLHVFNSYVVYISLCQKPNGSAALLLKWVPCFLHLVVFLQYLPLSPLRIPSPSSPSPSPFFSSLLCFLPVLWSRTGPRLWDLAPVPAWCKSGNCNFFPKSFTPLNMPLLSTGNIVQPKHV